MNNKIVVNILREERMRDLLEAIEREAEQEEQRYNNITFEEVNIKAIENKEVYAKKLTFIKKKRSKI